MIHLKPTANEDASKRTCDLKMLTRENTTLDICRETDRLVSMTSKARIWLGGSMSQSSGCVPDARDTKRSKVAFELSMMTLLCPLKIKPAWSLCLSMLEKTICE